MDADLALRLEQYNPWLVEPGVWPGAADRYLPEQVIPRRAGITLRKNRVSLVVGPRQAGKSTMIWLGLRGLERPPLLVNLDDPLLRAMCDSGAGFLSALPAPQGRFCALFFDEVQRHPEAALFLKSLADLKPGVPVVATGSSSFHLRAGTRESLAGRASRCILYPLSIAEAEAGLAAVPPHRHTLVMKEWLERFLVYGGYPEVWTGPDDRSRQSLLLDLVDTLVLRDASDAYGIRNPTAFRTLLRLAAGQIGSLLNMSEHAAVAGVSVSTVREYYGILEDSHILKLVRPYRGARRSELISAPKAFFVDNGLRNVLHGRFEPFEARGDRGPLFENLVFSELIKTLSPGEELHFWRTQNGAEVDFVASGPQGILPIEAKSTAMPRPAVTRSLRSFIDAYRPPCALVVNLTLDANLDLGGTEVRFRPISRLSAELSAAGFGAAS